MTTASPTPEAVERVRMMERRAMADMSPGAWAAVRVLNMRAEHTGGGCVALRFDLATGGYLLVVGQGGTFPRALAEPVTAAYYDSDDDPGDGGTGWPMLAALLLDLYGPTEGDKLPPDLAPCRHILDALDEMGRTCESCGAAAAWLDKSDRCNRCTDDPSRRDYPDPEADPLPPDHDDPPTEPDPLPYVEQITVELRAGKPFEPGHLTDAVQGALDKLLDRLASMDCAVRVEASDRVGFLAAAGSEPKQWGADPDA